MSVLAVVAGGSGTVGDGVIGASPGAAGSYGSLPPSLSGPPQFLSPPPFPRGPR